MSWPFEWCVYVLETLEGGKKEQLDLEEHFWFFMTYQTFPILRQDLIL